MRRNDREVTDPAQVAELLRDCKVCRLGMQDEEGLYIVPLNFGYDYQDGHLTLYFHSAKEGRKLTAMAANPSVCFEMDCGHELISAEAPCAYGYRFRSLIGQGQAVLLTQSQEKHHALERLMEHQAGKSFTFTQAMLDSVAVFQVEAKGFTAKWHK